MLKNESAQARKTLLGLVKNRSSEDAMEWLSKVSTKNMEIDWSQLAQYFDQKYLILASGTAEATLGTNMETCPLDIGESSMQQGLLDGDVGFFRSTRVQKLFDWYDRGETQTRKAALCAINLTDDDDVSAR